MAYPNRKISTETATHYECNWTCTSIKFQTQCCLQDSQWTKIPFDAISRGICFELLPDAIAYCWRPQKVVWWTVHWRGKLPRTLRFEVCVVLWDNSVFTHFILLRYRRLYKYVTLTTIHSCEPEHSKIFAVLSSITPCCFTTWATITKKMCTLSVLIICKNHWGLYIEALL